MPKRPTKPKREDFNEAAFRVVREATEEHDAEPQADGDAADAGAVHPAPQQPRQDAD